MIMDANVPDYDYTPSGVKVGTFRDTLVDKVSEIASNSITKKKPARKWYNRFFTPEHTNHDVNYSVEIQQVLKLLKTFQTFIEEELQLLMILFILLHTYQVI